MEYATLGLCWKAADIGHSKKRAGDRPLNHLPYELQANCSRISGYSKVTYCNQALLLIDPAFWPGGSMSDMAIFRQSARNFFQVNAEMRVGWDFARHRL